MSLAQQRWMRWSVSPSRRLAAMSRNRACNRRELIVSCEAPSRCDGIGRRDGLKIRWANHPCGFDPRHRHHRQKSLEYLATPQAALFGDSRDFFLPKSDPLRWAPILFFEEVGVLTDRAIILCLRPCLRLRAKTGASCKQAPAEIQRVPVVSIG